MLGCSQYATRLSEMVNHQFSFELAREFSPADVARIEAKGKALATHVEAYRLTVDATEGSFDHKSLSHLCYHFLKAGRDLKKIWSVDSELKAKMVKQTTRLLPDGKTASKAFCWHYVVFPTLVKKFGSEALGGMLYGTLKAYSSVGRALEARTMRSKEGSLKAGRFSFMEFSAHRGKPWEESFTEAIETRLGVWAPTEVISDATDLFAFGEPLEDLDTNFDDL